jgi:hypothetical protein
VRGKSTRPTGSLANVGGGSHGNVDAARVGNRTGGSARNRKI